MPPFTADRLLALLAARPLAYDRLREKDALAVYPAAFDRLIRDGKAHFRTILRQPPPKATFASVAEAAMEIGATLRMLWSVLGNHHQTSGDESTRLLIQKYQPVMTAFWNGMSLNADFYRLLTIVKKKGGLTPAQARSLYLVMRGMEVAGVHLPEKKKARLKVINKRKGLLAERFNDNVTRDRNTFFHRFADDSSLKDVPAQEKEMAKREAKKRKMTGYVFTLSPPSYVAIVRYCTDRAVRRKFINANHTVASSGAHDNRPIALELLRLRREKAKLLGYPTYAHYILDDRMAKTPAAALALLKTVGGHARTKARTDVSLLKKFSGIRDFQWWDVGFYGQKLRRKLYDVNEQELKHYFPLDRALWGMFDVAKTLFGLEFRPLRRGKDTITYEVRRGGKKTGEFVLDLFARPAKRPGAWCDCFDEPIVRGGKRLRPGIAINVASFGASAGKGPSLLRHGEVTTLFHEFGHALHVLLSETAYRNVHAFHVEWDFVELPSQLLEHWCWDAKPLARFARHSTTGKPIPAALLKRLKASKTFLQGIDTSLQTEYATMDLELHLRPPPKTVRDLDRFCHRLSSRMSALPVPSEHKRHASFQHIFAGGYGAGYYSYLWAEALEADVAEQFEKAGFLNKPLGERLRKEILAVGAMRPGMVSFRAFMARKPDPKALLRKRGLL